MREDGIYGEHTKKARESVRAVGGWDKFKLQMTKNKEKTPVTPAAPTVVTQVTVNEIFAKLGLAYTDRISTKFNTPSLEKGSTLHRRFSDAARGLADAVNAGQMTMQQVDQEVEKIISWYEDAAEKQNLSKRVGK